MKKLLFVIAVVIGIYFLQSLKSAKEELVYTSSMAKSFSNVVNDLSATWSYETLEKHIPAKHLNDNEQQYMLMLEQYQYLGPLVSCEEMSIGTVNASQFIDKRILQGECQWSNGTAKLTLIFSQEQEFMKLVLISINNPTAL